MTATPANGFIAGFWWMWIAFRNSLGYPMGQNPTPDVVVNNTVYTPFRILHPVSYTPANPTRVRATRQGGQGVRGQRDLGSSDLGTAQIVIDAQDEALFAMLTRSAVDVTTHDGVAAVSHNVNLSDPPSFIIGLSKGFGNINGNKEFLTDVYHNAQIIPSLAGASQQGGVNPNPLTYDIIPDLSERQGQGILFADSALEVVDDSDDLTSYRYSDPLIVSTYIADGTHTDAWIQGWLPRSSDATSGGLNLPAKNGVPTALASVNTGTAKNTLAAAGSAGDVWTSFGPTRFKAA